MIKWVWRLLKAVTFRIFVEVFHFEGLYRAPSYVIFLTWRLSFYSKHSITDSYKIGTLPPLKVLILIHKRHLLFLNSSLLK